MTCFHCGDPIPRPGQRDIVIAHGILSNLFWHTDGACADAYAAVEQQWNAQRAVQMRLELRA